MKLRRLLSIVDGSRWPLEYELHVPPGADGDPEIATVTHDSRAVVDGTLFCCVSGFKVDGHHFASEAARAGARALVAERVERTSPPLPQILVSDSRGAIGPLASALLGHPSDALEVVGVTGTNGKTTTVALLGHILRRAGRHCEVMGTLTGIRTTPEAPDLQFQLAALRRRGVASVAMEVSSHALELHRVDGTHFRVGVFTNLSPDHLDFHPTMEAYFRAKARLFQPQFIDVAVVNTDDPRGRLLLDSVTVPGVGFSLADAEALETRAMGSSFRWRGRAVDLPIGGRFNVSNALAAATTAEALGIDVEVITSALSSAPAVPGRFERIDVGQPFSVIVDYAHTPDGLERLLESSREAMHNAAKLVVVFGCGGDRDRVKRPMMGAIAGRLADLAVLTNDNPRTEDPMAILDEVYAGVEEPRRSGVRIEPDRRAAIAFAFSVAQPGDVVLIAGKGHETGQDIGGVVAPFDDRQVARTLLGPVTRSGRRDAEGSPACA